MFNAPAYKLAKGSQYTPTWEVGRDQPTPDDIANFQRNGYRGNSLIYACVREKATSYAGLRWLLTDGDEFRDQHDVLDLLEAPNVEMDGDELRQIIETYKEVAGNVYIRKVRQSRDFLERRSWPVQELRPIRPDYIEIRPGRQRADDLFVVKVDGVIKDMIPRADMIHIVEPDPANDYYGLSKVAVLLREGDLDQRMTDYERSFFINGGVPIGIIMTKTPTSQAEKAEIRSAFRRMFAGVGRWFNVLVLNADEGKYQQLGLPQADMEAETTRDFVESRICAVFGVPAVLVGAKVGLKHAADRANYQTGLYQFWTETMIPDAKSIANTLTRELFAEFRTSGDAGWHISHDFSKVEALQKDNSAKLTAAAALMREIGDVVTVNEVLTLAGLPTTESGDQVRVRPEPAPPASVRYRVLPERKELPEERWVDRHIRERMAIIARAENTLAGFLQEQATRLRRQLEEPVKAIDPGVLGPEEDALLFAAIAAHLEEAMASGWKLAALELGIDATFDLDDPAVRRVLEDAGERIGRITQTTREGVRDLLAHAQAEGWSVPQVADELVQLPEFGRARAETIARTEISSAQNRAAASRWRTSGLVQHVVVYDGIDYDAPCIEANGQTWTLDEFDANPYQHPRCIRTATPLRIEEAVA